MANYTKSQLRILKAANETFLALEQANPDLYYDSSGGHLMKLRYSNGTVLNNVRPDCSGVMRAIMMYMGYVVDGTNTRAWYGHTVNDIIKNKNGGYSGDWVVKNFDPTDRQPGDILVKQDHTDMFVFLDSSDKPRGFNAGAGNQGSSVSVYGMQYSCNLANYYAAHGTWTGGGPTIGGYTIKYEGSVLTLIRYVGAGSDQASTGETFTTDGDIYEVSLGQSNLLDDIADLHPAGVMIHVCNMRSYGVGNKAGSNDQAIVTNFKAAVRKFRSTTPMGFYFHDDLEFDASEPTVMNASFKCLQLLESMDINPDNAKLGVWLRMDTNSPSLKDPVTNMHIVAWFGNAISQSGYPTVGIYAPRNYISSESTPDEGNFPDDDMENVPIWVAWEGHTILDASTWAAVHGYEKLLLLQKSTETVGTGTSKVTKMVHPVAYGINDYDKEESGTSDTGTGTYSIVPAPRIIFSPTPGKIQIGTVVEVDTDAANTRIYVTTDNTVPNYRIPSQDWTGRRFTLNKNYHLRACAIDPNTGEVKARGSATYTIVWNRPGNEYSLDSILSSLRLVLKSSGTPHLERHTDKDRELIEYEGAGFSGN